MAFPWHDYVDMFAGDDWTIAGLLLGQDNLPCDLTGATISWILVDPNGFISLTEGAYTVNVLDPPTDGRIVVRVAASNTAALSAGRFTDGLRMIAADGTSTMWEGQIGVNITPFGATIGGSGGDGIIPIGSYVLRIGDTMLGPLTLNSNPTAPLHAAPKQYVDAVVAAGGGTPGGGTPGGATTQVQFNDGGVFGGNPDFTYDKTTGGLSTKAIHSVKVTLSADPANPLEAATKQYVDAARLQPAGAVGDGVADDTGAIQTAVDRKAYAVQLNTGELGGGVAQLSARLYRTTGPIHLGYGISGYAIGRINGDGCAFMGEYSYGTAISCDFSNAPGMCVSGGRRNTISNIGFRGKNASWLQSGYRGVNVADWIDPALGPNANSRTAPHAAIAIDPYAGPIPSPCYPPVNYPVFLGTGIPQYNKSLTSNVLISNCDFVGFVVAVVVQPNYDGNGDFIRLRDCNIDSCVYGISVGNTQARNTGCQDLVMNNVHTGFTNSIHGAQQGRFSTTFLNIHIGNSIQIFDLSLSVGGPIIIQSVYAEQGYMIGRIRGATASETALTILDPCLGFENQTTAGLAQHGVPPRLLECSSGVAAFIMREGYLNNFYSVAGIGTNLENTLIDGTLMQPMAESRNYPHEWFGHNALAGGLVFNSLGYLALRRDIHPKFVPRNLDDGSGFGTTRVGDIWLTDRLRCTPLWSRLHAGRYDVYGTVEGVVVPQRVQPMDATTFFTNPTLTGRTLTMTMPNVGPEWQIQNGPLPGDVILHGETGSTFFVSGYSSPPGTSGVVTAKLQNNFRLDNTNIVPIDWTQGSLYVGNARCYSPANATYGNFTAGSAVITNCTRKDGTNAWVDDYISVGDYIFFDASVDSILGAGIFVSRVVATNNAAKTITLATPAAATATVKRLGTFIRAFATS